MKILKSSFHFQPSDDLFPIDKFRQITEFIKITANLKRRFVMVTTPDILTALSMVMRLDPIGNLLWQGRIEGNQFQIIPDIFHPMDKPGYILIRYVDADTVTLIEFEEHMMGVAGFDSIVRRENDEESNVRYENEMSPSDEESQDQEVNVYLPDEAQGKDPRYFQVAEKVGDKYVFDPEICRPSTEICGECIHGVCCEKANNAKHAARKYAQMNAKALEPIEVQWGCVAELTEKKLKDHEVPFESKDFGSSYVIRFELGKHRYRIEFKLRPDLSNIATVSKFDIDPDVKVGCVLYRDEVNSPESMSEYLSQVDSILDDEVVEELVKEHPVENIETFVERILDDAEIKYNVSTNDIKKNRVYHCTIGDKEYMIDTEANNGGKPLVALYRIGKDPSDQEMLFFDADMTSEKYKDLSSYIAKLMDANTGDDEIPLWKSPIERIEKVLYNFRIKYNREDNGSCHYIRYENGCHEYCVYFENRDEVMAGAYYAVFSEKGYGEGRGLWQGMIDSYNKLHELELAITKRIKPEAEEC